MKIRTLATLTLFSAFITLPACNKDTTVSASGKALTVTVKSDQTIEVGETDSVLVTVTRKGFEDPVDIAFGGLPSGVTLKMAGAIARDDNMKTYELMASPTAPAVNAHRVTVTAKAAGLVVTEGFDLTVKKD